jgi:hypothetical protein
MGLYLRKSISVGPFRFNLSGSGLGVSTGVKGFRIGTGPRGNYVQMGRNGIYFRSTLPSQSTRRPPPAVPEPAAGTVQLEEIESGSVGLMVDSSSAELLQEMNTKASKVAWWPITLGLFVAITALIAALSGPVWVLVLLGVIGSSAVAFAAHMDTLRKTVVLFYELDPHMEASYQAVHDAFDGLAGCYGIWHIDARGAVTSLYDWKTNAGASSIIKRKSVRFQKGAPPRVKTNISVPFIPAGRQTLYLFPDRMLVMDGSQFGAVSYDKLVVESGPSRFIEEDGVPPDSKVVGSTWRYVNKSGGPDRRFNDNRELPIVLYESMLLRSDSGLQEMFHLSRSGTVEGFKAAVTALAKAITNPWEPEPGFIKCPCNNCSVTIEFPAHGVGQTVTCPHCGMDTLLFRPAARAQV